MFEITNKMNSATQNMWLFLHSHIAWGILLSLLQTNLHSYMDITHLFSNVNVNKYFFNDLEEKKTEHLKPLEVAALPLVGWCHDGEKRNEIIEQKIILALGKVKT